MSYTITIDNDSARPKYQQIADCILSGIQARLIGVREQLPSINTVSAQYDVSRDTVERAYKILMRDGIIHSVRGKGYYTKCTAGDAPRRVLILLDSLGERNRAIYEGFCERLPAAVDVEVRCYDGSLRRFEAMLERYRAGVTDFVIAPSFVGGSAARARELVESRLGGSSVTFVGSSLPGIGLAFGSVAMDHRRDVVQGLGEALPQLRRYASLHLIFDPESAARGIIEGFLNFTAQEALAATVETGEFGPDELVPGTAYLVQTDRQLGHVVKLARERGLRFGSDIGLIAYDDSPLKEVVAGGVTVIATDHRAIGHEAAAMLIRGTVARLRAPYRLLRRATL